MLEIILAIVGTWVVLSALYGWRQETPNRTIENVLDYAISLPWIIVGIAIVIMCYPIMCVWKFFRNAIKGVSAECWAKFQPKHHFKIGNFYFCYDKKARAFCNKLFLVRVVVQRETIARDVEIITSNIPSTPPGEFR